MLRVSATRLRASTSCKDARKLDILTEAKREAEPPIPMGVLFVCVCWVLVGFVCVVCFPYFAGARSFFFDLQLRMSDDRPSFIARSACEKKKSLQIPMAFCVGDGAVRSKTFRTSVDNFHNSPGEGMELLNFHQVRSLKSSRFRKHSRRQ